MSDGMPKAASGGNRTSPSSVQRKVPLVPGASSSPESPSSRHSPTAHGFRARNESAPASSDTPPTSIDRSFPPTRWSASTTVTWACR
jgi:hypothetical protein